MVLGWAGAGCGDPDPVPPDAGGDPTATTPTATTTPGAANDTQYFSELGISFTLNRGLRVQARSPEDHELRLVGRPTLEGALDGRMMLVTREGKTQALREAMQALANQWNATQRDGESSGVVIAQPQIVENFHPPGENNLTIVKMRMQMQMPLSPPPGSDPGEVHVADVVAAGYFITLKPPAPAPAATPTGAGAGATTTPVSTGTAPVTIVAIFIFEASPATEAIPDTMIRSIRAR